eukprot:scaffold129271_cov37-Prasinocladus_malaysianus.AAC.1
MLRVAKRRPHPMPFEVHIDTSVSLESGTDAYGYAECTDEVPAFDIPEELLVYKGSSDDRKAIMKHKRQVQQLQEECEQKK